MSTIKATNFQHASAAAPAIVLAADGSATANVSSINNGPLAGMRNAIINGNFDIWQRGTSFASPTNANYTADRWKVQFNNTGATRTLSRQSFALGQTDVPGEPTYFMRFDQSVAGSGGTFTQLDQYIESVRTFAGQQVTISFWAKAAASTTMPSVALQQLFGTGGSPSSLNQTTAGSSLALTTTWQKFSYQVTLPSISGKTLGTDNNDALIVVFFMPLNATFTIDIAQVQMEPGPVATPFERRPIGTELALCQRYYQEVDSFFAGSGGPIASLDYRGPFAVPMRTTPTVTVSGITNSNTSGATMTAINSKTWRAAATITVANVGYAFGATGRFDAEL
jgi:hypothetical protein